MRVALLLLCGFSLAAHESQTVLGMPNWSDNMFGNFNFDRIGEDVQNRIQSMTQKITENVNARVAQAEERASEAIKNSGNSGTNVRVGGNTVVVNSSNGGTSQKTRSGTDANGNPYYIEDLTIGNTLFHTERVYNPNTKKMEEHRYTLDLSDSNAKPVYQA